MNIGVIGLGVMGGAMARNLMKGGHAVHVYARRPEAADVLVGAGARFHATPAALAAACEVVVTMVTSSSDVEQIVFGAHGIAEGARPGSLVLEMETIDPSVARSIAERLAAEGIGMLDAPVSGGPSGAEQATLSIMAGGSETEFQRALPVFQCLGKTILHMGPSGAGQVTKACNQLALLVAAEGVAEALTLASSCGLDPARVREVMMGGVASSRVLELFGARMVSRDFTAGIESRLYHKDLDIVLALGHERGVPLPGASLVMQHINAMVGRGDGRQDLSAIIRILESMAGK